MRWPTEHGRRNQAGLPLAALLVTLALIAWLVVRGQPTGGTASVGGAASPPAHAPNLPPAAPSSAASAPTPAALRVLQLAIADGDWRVLAAARERALAEGVIVQDAAAVVPVAVTFGRETATGTARLKGDWLDHVDTDQWSLRLELAEPIAGMRRFSIQHPKTRGFLLEWLVMNVARREGILAPRADFVQVEINGKARGVYYLEEHFAKELVESQGRRDGPIVRFTEESLWAMVRQYAFRGGGRIPVEAAAAGTLLAAAPEAFGEQRLSALADLNQRLQRALEQVRGLQDAMVAEYHDRPLRRMQALAQLDARANDEVFAAPRVGDWLALYTVFHCLHGLSWHQLRFYHDPVLDRLEPIAFDTGANLVGADGTLAMSSGEAQVVFLRSPRVWEAAYAALGRFTEPAWYRGWAAALRPAAERAAAAMTAAGAPPSPGVDAIFDDLLPKQLDALRAVSRPHAAAAFTACIIGARQGPAAGERAIEVEAWALTDVPIRVHGFRFQDGRLVPAGATAAVFAGTGDAVVEGRDEGGSLLLPRDGSHLRLRFPVDRRLADLTDVQALKRAIRERAEPDRGRQIAVEVLYRPVTEAAPRVQALALRWQEDADAGARGRPPAPPLADVLARHPFLGFDLDSGVVSIAKGRHAVRGDLLVPDGHTLRLNPGAHVLLEPGAVIVASTLIAEGVAADPVEIGPIDAEAGWAGLLVTGGSPSRLRHCRIRGTTSIQRGGWQTTGGVTFYRAAVDLEDCAFLDSRGEDACNLFGARFQMVRTEFRGAASDLLDGDFVTGEISDCTFAESVGDAVDVSGAHVRVRGTTFTKIGDKAISVGEESRVDVRGCTVRSASIAVAAKDASEVEIDGLAIESVVNFALAAFVKKTEYGPAVIRARGLVRGALPDLVQKGCTVAVDGVPVPGVEADVEALYRSKVLGK